MSAKKLKIREGTIAEVVGLSQSIPEFDNPHPAEVYEQRLKNKKHLIAIAEVENELVGFKVGYDKFDNSSFYTWMGGVVPKYRRLGAAKALADFQEEFVIAHGFDAIILKTRNKHKKMLHFALSSGFEIIGVEQKTDILENRILLKKIVKK